MPNQVSSRPPAMPPTGPMPHRHPLAWVLIGAVIVIGLSVGYLAYNLATTTNTSVANINTASRNQNITANLLANSNSAVTENVNLSTNTNINPSSEPVTRDVDGSIAWHTPSLVTGLTVLGKDTEGWDYEDDAKYFEVGTFRSGQYKNASLIVYEFSYPGLGTTRELAWLVKSGQTITYLQAKNTEYIQTLFKDRDVKSDMTTTIADLDYPDSITGPNRRQVLHLQSITGFLGAGSASQMFDVTGLTLVFTDARYGSVYQHLSDDTTQKNSLYGRNGFFLRAPDGTLRVYAYVPDVITPSGDEQNRVGRLNATWADGAKNANDYYYASLGGCGLTNYVSLAPASLSPTAGTIRVGMTAQGDELFAPVDTNHEVLTELYKNAYFDAGKKPTYQTFVADHPVVFMTDPFGRFIQFSTAKYQPLTECGKPVIYLYPKQRTSASVKLDPIGGFSKTEPAYGDGWNVMAEPNGQLTDMRTGQRFPYLFWEGRGGLYAEPSQGFVVAQSDVHGFLTSSLSQLGLNQRETADFIEFWEPRMHGSPYYAIGFYGTEVMDQLAPLTITPKPDTMIRILMDFRPLSHPINLEPQQLRSTPRTGFTVIEWGGVLR